MHIHSRKIALLLVLAAACAGALPQTASAETFTYPDLVKRMIDLEGLSVLPPPGETCKQWSSYDRASKYDAETGQYIHWSANGDGGHMIRQEGDTWVMADMKGPGCIFRIWSALSKMGHVKIYLDGSPDPVVDLPFKEYFTGKTAPFNYPSMSYHLADQKCRGENLYFPIPYQTSCKIVAEKDWGAYFQFNYVTFPEGTQVPSFTGKLSEADQKALEQVEDFFQNKLGRDPAGERTGQETIQEQVRIEPGATESITLEGPRAVTALKAVLDIKDRETQEKTLRHLVLTIAFDGQESPSVWCPLGDFFGTAPGINPYKSLMTGMTPEGAYAYWYMPFAEKAVLALTNEGDAACELDVAITHAPLDRPFKGLGHFHCKWHRDLAPLGKDRFPDWTLLKATGRGRFCGVMLHVWNARGGWWGEGDEKFFVDGEKFPSTFGTGSEDYFGYAWCHPGLFQTPYHCQTMTQNNKGHQSVLRWHLADSIPFQTGFEGAIEKYYGNERGTLYACVPCWYMAPGGGDTIKPAPADQRWGYCIPMPPGGAGFKVIGTFKGAVEEQHMGGWGRHWKNDVQMWWTGGSPGCKLNVALKARAKGTYKVTARMTRAIDYGIVQLYINGKKAGGPIDLFNDGVVPSGPIPIGTHALAEGENTLTLEIIGANEKAVKSYMVGLSEIILEKVKP